MPKYSVYLDEGKQPSVVATITTTPTVKWSGNPRIIRSLQNRLKAQKLPLDDPEALEWLYQHVSGSYLWIAREEAER